MGVLSRFKDIMSANINSLLDKAEDPEKMVDQILRNLNKDLANVKEETAEIMADEKKAKRDLDEVNAEVAKLQTYMQKRLFLLEMMMMQRSSWPRRHVWLRSRQLFSRHMMLLFQIQQRCVRCMIS